MKKKWNNVFHIMVMLCCTITDLGGSEKKFDYYVHAISKLKRFQKTEIILRFHRYIASHHTFAGVVYKLNSYIGDTGN